MTKHQNKLPLAWFGLQKRETERYLSKCDALYNSEAEQLEALIKSEKMLNKQLKQELDQKTALLNEQKYDRMDGFADLLRQRLERSIEALRRQGEAEREELLALMETKRNEQARKLAGIDQQLAEYRVSFNGLLAEASSLISKLKEKPVKGNPSIGEEDIVSALSALSKPIELEEEEYGEMAKDEELEQAGQSESKFAGGANVIQFRMKSILDSLQDAESEQSVVTADGLSAPAAPAAIQREYPRQKAQEASSEFWGDLNLYMPDGYEEPEGTAASLPSEAPPVIPIVSERAAASAEKELAEAQAAPSEPETSASAVSPALAEEIKSIQYRYIAGKAAGENLYADGGALIIGKGEIITAETIQKAESAGKMPDLIVQMVIPGFAEPS